MLAGEIPVYGGGNSLFPAADAVIIACDVRVNCTCEMLLRSSEGE